jgi:hypothetical protein
LRQGVSSFEFDALIQGVSSVEEATPQPPAVSPQLPSSERSVETATPQPPSYGSQPSSSDRDGLRTAIGTLGERLLQETGKLAQALQMHDAAEGGYYLSRVNQVLDLLHAVDPRGDLARSLATPFAPPQGRTWPRAAWSLYDFAESPISGLLPADADAAFCAAIIAEAISDSES